MQPSDYKRALVAAALLVAGTGCEKVVNLALKTSPSQLVIEGTLADDGRPGQVRVSRSIPYTETNNFPPVSGAVVTLADNAGGLETLREAGTGQYAGAAIKGVAGRTYTLRVETGGAAYVAVSTLPPALPFEVLKTQENPFGADEGLQAVVEYADPPGRGNGHVFRQYRNGRLNQTLFLQNDEFNDGKRVSQPLRVPGGGGNDPQDLDKLAAGDSLVVEMQNVDPGAYEYFRTLNQILQGSAFGTTPANPQTNFSGDVLGYFSAYSQRVRRIKIP